MSELVGVQLDGSTPGVAALANLRSIENDLVVVEWLCERLATIHPAVSGDTTRHLETRAFWESAIITYGRCFKGGASHFLRGEQRRVPDEVMRQLTDDERQTHDWALRERDKHIAHRVDATAEEMRVAIHFYGDQFELLFQGTRHVAGDPDQCASLGKLAGRLRNLVAGQAEGVTQKITDSLKGSVSILRHRATPLWGPLPPSDG